MQKRIITINEKFSDNIGDQALSEAMTEFCKLSSGIIVESVDYSFRPPIREEKKALSGSFSSKRLPSWLKKIGLILVNSNKAKRIARKQYDLAIIGGGQLILGNESFSVSMLLYVVFFKLYGTRVKLVSVGVGERFGFLDKCLFGISLRLADKIFLRDQHSINNLERLFGISASFCPDIAYYLCDENKFKSLRQSPSAILICPIDYSVFARYYQEAGRGLLTIEEYQSEWLRIITRSLLTYRKVYLSGTTRKDLAFSKSLCKKLESSCQGRPIQFIEIKHFDEFMKVAGCCDAVLSGRMHALILSHNLGLDIFPCQISQKIMAYQNEYLHHSAIHFKKILLSLRCQIIA